MNQGKATANMDCSPRCDLSAEIREYLISCRTFEYQTERLKKFRNTLVDEMTGKVRELNRDNFAVRQHLKYVDLYSASENYQTLTYADTLAVKTELAPLIEPENDNAQAL